MKKFFISFFIFVLAIILGGCTKTLDKISTPTNITSQNYILTWSLQDSVKYYEVEMTILDNITYHEVVDSFDFSSYVDSNIKEIMFRVKGLKLETNYYDNSNYSTTYIYKNPNYIENFEKDILRQTFVNQKTAPNGWVYNYNASLYADGTLKFTKNGESITSNTFKSTTTFKVEATIIGKNTGGDATITIYGLDETNAVLEKVLINGPILNNKNTICATFSNSNITKIKFEYSKKATGNFGLFEIYIYQLSKDDIVSMNACDLKTNYIIGEEFEYKGYLNVKYSSGNTKRIDISTIKDEITISNFINNKFYKGELKITYKDMVISSPYTMSYHYPSLNHSFEYTDVIIREDIIYIKLDTIDILIILTESYNQEYIYNLIAKNDIDYLISQNYIENINTKEFIGFNENNNLTYCISPTATLTYTPNGILLKNYKTKVLIDTTGDIDNEIVSSYDYIITKSSNYLAKTNNLILNKTTTVNDYENLNYIYMNYSNTFICDFSYQDEISFRIDKYSSNYTSSVTEISSQDNWDYEYKHIDNLYQYNHEEYYDALIGLTGKALKEKLAQIVTATHTNIVDYDFARTAYILTDPDLDTPGNIILFYSGKSTDGTWENGITWNREHVWPKSLSGGLYPTLSGSSKNAGTDLHQLRPALTSINSSRNNKPFGPVTDHIYFEPRNEIKGDVARIIFYMNIRYNMDIEILGVAQSIELLISWHNSDPVDYYETYRNEKIQEIQGNYNPFIDNPWLVDWIY